MSKRLVCSLILSALLFSSSFAEAQGTEPGPVDEATATRIGRATLLAVHLEDMETRSDVLPWGIGLGMALGTAALGAGVFVDDLPSRPGFIVGGALALGGGIAAFAADESLRAPLGFASYFGGIGALSIGVALAEEDFFVPGLAIGLGTSLSATLMLVSSAIRPQVPASWLARDYERLRDPKVRGAMSEAEVAAIEDRYRRLAPAMNPRILFAPMIIGNAVAAASFMESAETDLGKAYATLTTLGVGVVLPLLFLLQPIDYEAYEAECEVAGITLSVAPTGTGVGVHGSF